jgi:hypothetical protein
MSEKFEWDYDYLKGEMIGEYIEDIVVGTDHRGDEVTQSFIIPWTTIKDILRDGLAAMEKKGIQ